MEKYREVLENQGEINDQSHLTARLEVAIKRRDEFLASIEKFKNQGLDVEPLQGQANILIAEAKALQNRLMESKE